MPRISAKQQLMDDINKMIDIQLAIRMEESSDDSAGDEEDDEVIDDLIASSVSLAST